MRKIKITKELSQVNMNLNQGAAGSRFFTQEEKDDFQKGFAQKQQGSYSHPITVHFYNYMTHLELDKEELQDKLGLVPLMRIIKKLSKGDRGALAKQLYPYYEKVGISKLKYDVRKLYKYKDKVDISDLDNRQYHFTTLSIYVGKKTYFSARDEADALALLTRDHLNRCIAILANKGYITTSKTQKDTRMKGYGYTYRNTYYKLTDKAEKRLLVSK